MRAQPVPVTEPDRGATKDAASDEAVEPEIVTDAIIPRAPRTAAIMLLIASVLGAAALIVEDAQRHAHAVEAHTRMHAVLRRPTPTPQTPSATLVVAATVHRAVRPAPRSTTNHAPRAAARPSVARTLAQVTTTTSAGPRRSPLCPVR